MASKSRRISRVAHPDPEKAANGEQVEVEYIDYSLVKEDWSIWELADGTRVRAKIVLSEVYIAIDLDTGERMQREDGAPKYGARMGITVVFEPDERVFPADAPE